MQQYHLDISMPVALEQSFTYLAAEKIPSGCRVTVPFGERNRQTVGVVLGISQKAPDPAYKLKAILARLDEIPIYSS
ncbi:MAG: hypothetical protein M3Q07_12205, partial [Pseudobdellovibrionaceae bacterium]|nr:hypothetical protein [Pseudobdellovibrionaceae bacterium]